MIASLPSRVAVVGLGYVGLPLATAFSKVLPTIGFDINPDRIAELRNGSDRNGEIDKASLGASPLELTFEPSQLCRASLIIVAVPTPVDKAKRPDLSPLIHASRLIGKNLTAGTIVVYESTVYPGCTEEVCIPVLESESGLTAGRDFKIGYSPERVNPGDTEHTLETVKKIVAGQDAETGEVLATVYGLVAKAGIHQASSIRVAEAAKVIENIQRDLNIALMNELAVLFHRIGLDTAEVFKAARSKWNFLPFEPGLVGGHCIPVDPYYLTHKAQEIDYHPDVILAGRRINDSMGVYVAQETIKLLIKSGKIVRGAKALVLGAAFKENVCDVRNTRVAELIQELQSHGVDVALTDPLVACKDLERFKIKVVSNPFKGSEKYDAVILSVPHRTFREQSIDAYMNLLANGNEPAVFVDIKGVLGEIRVNKDLLYWSL
ncbi:MAG: nucleotide sugar dehydrogenase [Deltaproteobacteria bacterium]|nr:nucleotide sugar dehydrogenase [Deltaproteobacteria bacterium]